MFRLLWEDLKLYKLNFLVSISLSFFVVFIIQILKFEISSLILLILVFFLEFKRYTLITNNGYFALINKLPITKSEIYFIKFFSSISGILVIMLPFCVSDFFIPYKKEFFYYSNIFISNLMVGLIINNNTNLFRYKNVQKNAFQLIGLFLGLLINFSIFSYILSDERIILKNNHYGLNYLLCLIIQLIFLFYYGKIINYFFEKSLKIK
jgi:hypothetical protein